MTLDEPKSIDPNTADLDTLCLLPGIGPALARRIIAARPFETVQDLTRVRGVSSAAIERWIPRLTVSSAAIQPPTPDPDLSEDEDGPVEVEYVEAKVVPAGLSVEAESDETEAGPAQVAEDEHPALPQATTDITLERRRPVVTRSYVGWLIAVSGLFVLVLSLLLNLGILAALNNNQLQFVSPAQISGLAVRIEGMEARADGLGQEVDGLRTRLSNLEAMGERMSAVELAAGALRTEVDAAATEVADLSTQVNTVEDDLLTASEQLDDLKTEVGMLQTQSGRFQTFLDGLQALMDSLFQSEGGQ
jgi:hypothetical protein